MRRERRAFRAKAIPILAAVQERQPNNSLERAGDAAPREKEKEISVTEGPFEVTVPGRSDK